MEFLNLKTQMTRIARAQGHWSARTQCQSDTVAGCKGISAPVTQVKLITGQRVTRHAKVSLYQKHILSSPSWKNNISITFNIMLVLQYNCIRHTGLAHPERLPSTWLNCLLFLWANSMPITFHNLCYVEQCIIWNSNLFKMIHFCTRVFLPTFHKNGKNLKGAF